MFIFSPKFRFKRSLILYHHQSGVYFATNITLIEACVKIDIFNIKNAEMVLYFTILETIGGPKSTEKNYNNSNYQPYGPY